MWEICRQLRHFDSIARRNIMAAKTRPRPRVFAPGVPTEPQLSPAVPRQNYAPTAYDCMDMQCLCPYFRVSL